MTCGWNPRLMTEPNCMPLLSTGDSRRLKEVSDRTVVENLRLTNKNNDLFT